MSAGTIDIIVPVKLTGEQLALSFWELDADEQADFFAALERVAGINLCFQMAGVVREIVGRTDRGDYDAMNGFRTMLNHAQEYADSATEIRTSDARRMIGGMVQSARARA